ncbi:hypothetical protein HK102_006627, partial [Quaeritorhiza haematococci]
TIYNTCYCSLTENPTDISPVLDAVRSLQRFVSFAPEFRQFQQSVSKQPAHLRSSVETSVDDILDNIFNIFHQYLFASSSISDTSDSDNQQQYRRTGSSNNVAVDEVDVSWPFCLVLCKLLWLITVRTLTCAHLDGSFQIDRLSVNTRRLNETMQIVLRRAGGIQPNVPITGRLESSTLDTRQKTQRADGCTSLPTSEFTWPPMHNPAYVFGINRHLSCLVSMFTTPTHEEDDSTSQLQKCVPATAGDVASGWYVQGHAHYRAGQYPAAVQCFELALQKPSDWSVPRSAILLAYGCSLYRMGRPISSILYFKNAITESSSGSSPATNISTTKPKSTVTTASTSSTSLNTNSSSSSDQPSSVQFTNTLCFQAVYNICVVFESLGDEEAEIELLEYLVEGIFTTATKTPSLLPPALPYIRTVLQLGNLLLRRDGSRRISNANTTTTTTEPEPPASGQKTTKSDELGGAVCRRVGHIYESMLDILHLVPVRYGGRSTRDPHVQPSA